MEREILTRNFMTGWLLVAGFLASWLPGNLEKAALLLKTASSDKDSGLAVITAAALAILSTPVIGFAISALVLAYLYVRFGSPYSAHSRAMAVQLAEKECRPLYDMLEHMPGKDDDLFAYLIYLYGPDRLIEWGRRRHTTRFIGYNCTVATVLGLVLGATLVKWPSMYALWSPFGWGVLLLTVSFFERRWHERHDSANQSVKPGIRSPRFQPFSLVFVSGTGLCYSIGIIMYSHSRPETLLMMAIVWSISAVLLYLGIRSSWEVEHVERLWIEHYISERLATSPASHDGWRKL